jgi:hypothetical protein
LRERITHSFRLEPLTPGEIREYLMFRMRAAGYRGPDLFSDSVVKSIARSSQGLTRRVNLIADKALLAAFSENTHTLRSKHIEAAVRDSEFSQQVSHRIENGRLWGGAALVAAGAVLGIAIYALLQHASQGPATVARASRNDIASVAGNPPAPAGTVQPGAAAPVSRPIAPAGASVTIEAGVEPDLLDARLAATQEWLSREAQTTFSIQLMGTHDPQQLKNLLNSMGKFVEINKVFVYRTQALQKPSLTVLYGSFSNVRDAREALDKLPESLRANRPILRTVQGIRAEIRKHEPS